MGLEAMRGAMRGAIRDDVLFLNKELKNLKKHRVVIYIYI